MAQTILEDRIAWAPCIYGSVAVHNKAVNNLQSSYILGVLWWNILTFPSCKDQ